MSNIHEEEALGKAYDSHLMKRLLEYMRPYKWRVIFALALVAVVTPLELAPPALFGKAIDKYLVPGAGHHVSLHDARHGLVLISAIWLLVIAFDFLAQYIQIRIMQRVGQQTMYDMRAEIFGRLQRLPMSYFDRNPVGRLMTRVTTDVDALNDLFAAGVVTMINDFFLLVVMAVVLFVIDARLRIGGIGSFAVYFCGDNRLPEICARREPQNPHGNCAHQRVSAGIHFRNERCATVQSRTQGARGIYQTE